MTSGININEVCLTRLGAKDAAALSALLLSAPEEYSRYFTPFDFGLESLTKILSQAKRDLYFGVLVGPELAGFYMLRGFDQGYDIPAYGVWISPRFQGRGLASLTLAHAFSLCRLNGLTRLMLKVHPDNTAAKVLYERLGFVKTGVDPKNKNDVYHKIFV